MRDTGHSLYMLAYMSRSRLDGDAAIVRREIELLLARARERNEREGVTGLLMFDDVIFAQILEGTRHAVELIFERLRTDPRHQDIVVLTREPLDERAFDDWSMACVEGEAGLLDRYFTCRLEEAVAEPTPDYEPLLAEVEFLAGRAGRARVRGLLVPSSPAMPTRF